VIVSRFVSSHASRARLHVNARTHPLRQTMRQVHTVARRGGDSPSQPRTSTIGSPQRSHGAVPMIAAPALGLHDRNSFNDSRKRLIQMANYLLTSATVAPSTRSVPTCSNLPKGR
jgi:hypothetical protein